MIVTEKTRILEMANTISLLDNVEINNSQTGKGWAMILKTTTYCA
jgi:hypothetical protein